MFDYALVFDSELQADMVINSAVNELHARDYVVYTIGQIIEYVFDEQNPAAEPTVIVVSDKWHVNLRLRTANDALDEYRVYPSSPVHSFS